MSENSSATPRETLPVSTTSSTTGGSAAAIRSATFCSSRALDVGTQRIYRRNGATSRTPHKPLLRRHPRTLGQLSDLAPERHNRGRADTHGGYRSCPFAPAGLSATASASTAPSKAVPVKVGFTKEQVLRVLGMNHSTVCGRRLNGRCSEVVWVYVGVGAARARVAVYFKAERVTAVFASTQVPA